MTDKQSRYQQVADYVRERILDGTFAAGQPLPSEQQLAEEFSVSRPTIRNAIAELRSEGLVEVMMGRGMFVRSPHTRPELTRPRGVHRDANGQYAELERTRFTEAEAGQWTKLDAPMALADALSIPVGQPMYTYEATESADYGRLRQIHRVYVPFSVVADTPMDDGAPPRPPELYQGLEAAGHHLHWREHVRARMPLQGEARTLKLAAGTPLLELLRLTLNHDAKPLALEEILTPGDTQELTYTFGPQGTPGRRTR